MLRTNVIQLLLAAGLPCVLSACSQPEQEHQTVGWYQDHDNERGAKLTWCAEDAARQSTVDCRNAASAMARGRRDGKHFEPKMDWGSATPKPPAPTNP